jgi:hypothetical protein
MSDQEFTPAAVSPQIPLTRIVIAVTVVLVLVVAGVVGIALLIAQGDVERWAAIMQIFRDIFIVFLSLQGILIIVAIAVLIVQIARLVNLLQNEISPILKNAQETANTAAGTARFVGENLSEPLIAFSSFLASLSLFLREAGGIRRALTHIEPDPATDEPPVAPTG